VNSIIQHVVDYLSKTKTLEDTLIKLDNIVKPFAKVARRSRKAALLIKPVANFVDRAKRRAKAIENAVAPIRNKIQEFSDCLSEIHNRVTSLLDTIQGLPDANATETKLQRFLADINAILRQARSELSDFEKNLRTSSLITTTSVIILSIKPLIDKLHHFLNFQISGLSVQEILDWVDGCLTTCIPGRELLDEIPLPPLNVHLPALNLPTADCKSLLAYEIQKKIHGSPGHTSADC
jgi:predicted translin family RNA/ssDNA-binding protein